jgi:hypothetical protein
MPHPGRLIRAGTHAELTAGMGSRLLRSQPAWERDGTVDPARRLSLPDSAPRRRRVRLSAGPTFARHMRPQSPRRPATFPRSARITVASVDG